MSVSRRFIIIIITNQLTLFTAAVESRSEVEVSSAWKVTVDFAVAVVDSVQTHTFPYGKSSLTPHSTL